ncbi:hypothetical protein SAMN04489712_10132 [Thermomonospora echinospora]|uniref:Uncharacterized protein n=1 Tax=Thermomonospora echinospora TaxID=1992 RepID=A0A1H5S0L9_9ACTN|nr:hypothetical protein SAMN04489712_10132 [Thermomonospora echinospora]
MWKLPVRESNWTYDMDSHKMWNGVLKSPPVGDGTLDVVEP